MNSFRLLLLIMTPLFVNGCGTKLAECGDKEAIETVKRLSEDIYKEYILKQISARDSHMSGYLNRAVPFGGLMVQGKVNIDQIQVNASKVDLVTTTKYDKELPMRQCSGEVTFNIPQKPADPNAEMSQLFSIFGNLGGGSVRYPEKGTVEYTIRPDAQNKSRMIYNVSLRFN